MNKIEHKRKLERYFDALDHDGKKQAFLYAMLHGKALVESQVDEYNTMYSFVRDYDRGEEDGY